MFRKRKTWITSAHRGFVEENVHQNTLDAYLLAAKKGADMIETDARMTKDGVLIVNHDPTIKAYDENGEFVEIIVSDTNYEDIKKLNFFKDRAIVSKVPTLEETLNLVYYTGMCINIDLKEGLLHAKEIALLVAKTGMRGRTVYATNGAGAPAIELILSIDPDARFIDTKINYTKEKLSSIKNYQSKCFVYTSDFSDENIAEIRKSGCLLDTCLLNAENADKAFKHHPDMAEYHLSDFEAIENEILKNAF